MLRHLPSHADSCVLASSVTTWVSLSPSRIRLGHLAARLCYLLHVHLTLEPLLRGHDRRRQPHAELGRGDASDGAAQRAADALAGHDGAAAAHRQRKRDEASKIEDRVEALDAHGHQAVGHDHALLAYREFKVREGHEGHAGRKDEELQRAGTW